LYLMAANDTDLLYPWRTADVAAYLLTAPSSFLQQSIHIVAPPSMARTCPVT
jgi:hypothetical protein